MMELRRAMFFDQAVDCVKAVACRPGLSPPLGLKKKIYPSAELLSPLIHPAPLARPFSKGLYAGDSPN
jgi:hypothetical protein